MLLSEDHSSLFMMKIFAMQAVEPPSVRKDRRGRVIKPVIDETQVYHWFLFFAIVLYWLLHLYETLCIV